MWGPLNSRNMGVEGKTYIVLYACSLSHALYMDLVSFFLVARLDTAWAPVDRT